MWPANKKVRVMVVDDSILARTMITQGLSKNPRIEVVGTGFNAQDAMAKVGQLRPDVITSDIEMPGMSGFEAARMIRRLGRADAEKIPIIALSANAFEEDIAMAKDAGMNEHLAKPVDMSKMFRTMRRLKTECRGF